MVLPQGLWCGYCQMTAGDAVILKPSSFACLVSGLRGLAGTAGAPKAPLSLSSQTLHLVASKALDFLPTWWLKPTRGTAPRETSRSYVVFSNPASEVTSHSVTSATLFIKTITEALPGVRKGVTGFTFSWDEYQWIFRHVYASLLHIWEIWKEMTTSSLALRCLSLLWVPWWSDNCLFLAPVTATLYPTTLPFVATITQCLVTMGLWPRGSHGQAGRIRVSFYSHILMCWVPC